MLQAELEHAAVAYNRDLFTSEGNPVRVVFVRKRCQMLAYKED